MSARTNPGRILVGGGSGGLCTACALSRRGFQGDLSEQGR